MHFESVCWAENHGPQSDNALQAELDQIAANGGGTLLISRSQVGGHLLVRDSNIAIEGNGNTLFDTRITIVPSARRVAVRNLTLVERSRRDDTWHLDVSGRDCVFENIKLIKEPAAGGYHAYFRAGSSECKMRGFVTAGSNGIFVAGSNHVFERFDMSTPIGARVGGDDAFAIKGAGSITSNISIREGRVRGFAAAVSIGSEIGASPEHPGRGAVIGVDVGMVEATDCERLIFVKPGALIYDWRRGLVKDISLNDLSLRDTTGRRFLGGIVILAGRGSVVEDVTARDILIIARTGQPRRQHSAALDIATSPEGEPATIRNIDVQLAFDGRGSAGVPVDHIAKIEKANPNRGRISHITLDITGQETRFGGVLVGPGLDDAVSFRRLRLSRLAIDPPSSLGAGGIWADSRIRMGDVEVSVVSGNRYGGDAAPY